MDADILTIVTEKGHKYLAFYPKQHDGSLLKELGFKPAKDENFVYWRKSYHPSIVKQVLRLYPHLEPNPYLWQQYEEWAILSNHADYDPEIIEKDAVLKPWQPDSSSFLAFRKRAFLALAPGLGKTLSALRAAEAAGYKRICVIAPLSLLDNWRNEIWRWLPDSAVGILRATGPQVYKAEKPKRIFFIMSYEGALRYYKALANRPFDLIIFDESILIKNRETIRFAGAPERKSKKGKILPEVEGISKLLASHKNAVWMLSGGPTSRYLDDLWAQLYLLDRKRFASYWVFANTYCMVEDTQWGSKILGNKANAFYNLRKDIDDIFYSRSQDEVGADLPEFIEETIEIDMDESQAKAYLEMETKFFAELPDGEVVLSANLLSQAVRLNQIASNLQLISSEAVTSASPLWDAVGATLEYIQKPAIVWVNFTETAGHLKAILGGKYNVGLLNGTVAITSRQDVADDFQAGKYDVLIAHPAVGKYGFTLTAARTAIYLESNMNGDDRYQSMFRIRRIGTTQRPHVIYMLSTRSGKRTIHHAIQALLKAKQDATLETITARALRAAYSGEEG